MARQKPKPTAKQLEFAKAFVSTEDPIYALMSAGYAPSSHASRLLQNRAVLEGVEALRAGYNFTCRAIPLVIEKQFERAMSDTIKTSDSNTAAKNIIMIFKELGLTKDGDTKPIEEMTADEMAKEIHELNLKRSELAKIIEAEVLEPEPGGLFD